MSDTPKPPARSELRRLAAQISLTGERLEHVGLILWDRSLGWKQGPRAANYDPDKGGWGHDRDTGEAIPSDPVGEEAIDRADSGHPAEQNIHAEMRTRLARVAMDTEWLNHHLAPFVHVTGRTDKPTVDGLAPADVSASGWCRSCFRDGGYLEPVHVDKHGAPVYRDFCRWCGDFKGAQKQPPPLSLVQSRHAGTRITEAQVAKALRRTG